MKYFPLYQRISEFFTDDMLTRYFSVNFVQVFTAKGGYEILNRLLLKWNDEDFLTHIVIVLGSTIMCKCPMATRSLFSHALFLSLFQAKNRAVL